MIDLWPKDIWDTGTIRVPVNMLKEQASFLGSKTKNLITAEAVELERSYYDDSRDFKYGFFIVAPTLDNYRYRLFTFSHDISLYPLEVEPDEDIFNEVSSSDSYSKKVTVESEEEFLDIVKKIFAASKTRRVIAVLKSMVDYDNKIDINESTDFPGLSENEIPF